MSKVTKSDFLKSLPNIVEQFRKVHDYFSEFEMNNNDEKLMLAINKISSSMTLLNTYYRENKQFIVPDIEKEENENGTEPRHEGKEEGKTQDGELPSKGSKAKQPPVSKEVVREEGSNAGGPDKHSSGGPKKAK